MQSLRHAQRATYNEEIESLHPTRAATAAAFRLRPQLAIRRFGRNDDDDDDGTERFTSNNHVPFP